MDLDELKKLGIVVGQIADAELGNKFIACIGKVTPGGIRSDVGQHWISDSPLKAAMARFKAFGLGKEVPGCAP